MPAPEPITMPSISETVGLEKHSCCQLSRYSAASASRHAAGSWRQPAIVSRTSPPAENALGEVERCTTQ
jgi:hypothetical protein